MSSMQTEKVILDGKDILVSQEKFKSRVRKNKTIFSWILLVLAVATLVAYFALPLYEYRLIPKKSGELSIIGKFTVVEIIQKFFNKELGAIGILNSCAVLTSVIIILTSIYLAVSSCALNFINKAKLSGFAKKVLSYDFIEKIVVIQFILLILNMVFSKVDVSGNADNGLGFWIVFVSSIAMTCFSISLSSNE